MTTARKRAVAAIMAAMAGGGFVAWHLGVFSGAAMAPGVANAATGDIAPAPNPTPAPDAAPVLELAEQQLQLIKIAAVGEHVFPVEQDAVGSIDFNEDMSVQVFTPYQGKIISAFVQVGDEVKKDQPLFTIDSPDLLQAESTLIGAAATYDQNNRALIRARRLYSSQGSGGIAEKDLDAAVQGKVSAEGAMNAARDAVRIFGKTEAEIDSMIQRQTVDPVLVVNSPFAGKIIARNAQPGLLVQPGNAPAPYTVADISTMWMQANIPEIDIGAIKAGEEVKVSVMAWTGKVYEGRISTVGAAIDPNLHTLLVRSDVENPQHDLRSGMFANFVIRTGDPITATAVPADSVVREGDGTMTVWVTTDRHRFTQRVVKIGLLDDGYDQIPDGLKPGEQVVTDGAIFLDNMLTASPTD